MTKKTSTQPIGRKRQWFAPRQVYLRTRQDSQYVELSPLLQIGVALGFGALALWLVGASYGAATGFLEQRKSVSLLTELETAKQERDAAALELVRIPELETALADARTATAMAQQVDETIGLAAELEQTKTQLDDLRTRLSEAKANEAALQARFEAETAGGDNPGDQAAEEASSLYGQLEEALGEIEGLQTERDEAKAKLVAITEESSAKDDQADRTDALLKAATSEIERLQNTLSEVDALGKKKGEHDEATIAELRSQLERETATREQLESEVDGLTAELNNKASASIQAAKTEATNDADHHARAIAADLKEADLLATIETLRTKVTASDAKDEPGSESDEVQVLKMQLALAEFEVERMIRNGLLGEEKAANASSPSGAVGPKEDADAQNAEDPGEIELLKSKLAATQSDVIKLRADVGAAKQRLAEQTVASEGSTVKSDNTDKLQQQLASTRSRVQQLNKALADAKLREVAIDLALINIIPSPSPPAPR